MTTQQLEAHIQDTPIPAIQSTSISEAEDGEEVVEVKFDHFEGSDPIPLTAYLQHNTLNFVIPVAKLSPEGNPPIEPLCWLDANSEVPFGRYEWDPQSERVSIFGQIPFSSSDDDPELVEWGLTHIISLFYRGHLKLTQQISIPRAINDGLLSQEEAQRKMENMVEGAQRLLGGSNETSDSNSDEYRETGI